MTNKTKNITALSAGLILMTLAGNTVFAQTCEPKYGGGETCVFNKRFKIEKEVRLEGDSEWKEKVRAGKGETVEFKITIKNKSDEGTPMDFDNMKMKDFLPEEMKRTGGDGLTEYWDNFEPGEKKSFIIKAQVRDSEFDRDEDFDDCVVNTAEVRFDGEFEGSDTAKVCFGKGTPKELPKTGAESVMGLLGLGMIAVGTVIRKSTKLAK